MSVELSIEDLMNLYAAIDLDQDGYGNFLSTKDKVLIKIKAAAFRTIVKAIENAS
jgi:hypothetical protein